MNNMYTTSRKTFNRVMVPLQALDTKNTTLLYPQLLTALENTKNNIIMLKMVNRVLTGLIACVFLYLTAVVLFSGVTPPAVESFMPAALNDKVHADSFQGAQTENQSRLEEMVKKRNIFRPAGMTSEKHFAAVESAREEIRKKITVVGIFIDSDPKVIIEILSSHETVFVSKGERVEGALIQEIFQDKVVVSYNGVELELNR